MSVCSLGLKGASTARSFIPDTVHAISLALFQFDTAALPGDTSDDK